MTRGRRAPIGRNPLRNRHGALLIGAILALWGAGATAQAVADETWTAAFRRLTTELRQNYAFTGWKELDWEARYESWAPAVRTAEKAGDVAAYYLALRGFVHSIADRHIKVRGEPENLRFGMVGGGFGLTLAATDEGGVYVTRLLPGGPADHAGLREGDRIVEVRGLPVDDALSQVNPLWARGLGGTLEALRLERLRWLARAPVGTADTWTYQSSSGNLSTVLLRAEFDHWWSAQQQDFYTTDEEREEPVQWRMLDGEIGYVKVTTLAHPDAAVANAIDDRFREAIQGFLEAGAEEMILDLRHNSGGRDELGAHLVGHFYSTTAPYLQVAYYDPATSGYRISGARDDLLEIHPTLPYFGGRVTVLVSPGTVSAGEGMAEAVVRLPNGQAAGFFGTNGSYGNTGGRVDLPGGFRVTYPVSASLGPDGRVLLDGDAAGRGGVAPTLRVPRTRTALLAQAHGRDPELEFVLHALRQDQPTANKEE